MLLFSDSVKFPPALISQTSFVFHDLPVFDYFSSIVFDCELPDI